MAQVPSGWLTVMTAFRIQSSISVSALSSVPGCRGAPGPRTTRRTSDDHRRTHAGCNHPRAGRSSAGARCHREEADKILLTHDPLGAMAESDAARIKALLLTVQTEDQAVRDLLKHTAGERLWTVLHPEEIREAEISPNRADELRETWGVESGQVWQAGAHRIICGDSRERRNLEKLGADPFRLIVSDPPYGVNYAAKNKYLNSSDRGTRIQKPIENDGLPPNEVKALFEASIREALAFALPGAACYATVPSGPLLPYFIAGFEEAGLSFKHLLVWVKQ
jgi:hypothetical protein